MTERDACALLKARFEAAGYTIAENQPFDEDGIHFEIDGFDADARVGYEYITDEAGDTWDVDDKVVAALATKLRAGTLSVLVIGENDAPDATALARAADAFLKGLAPAKATKAAPAAKAAPSKTAPKKDAAATAPKSKPAASPRMPATSKARATAKPAVMKSKSTKAKKG